MKICLVGIGPWGENIARTLSALNSLSAIVETEPSRRDQVSKLFPDARVFDSLHSVPKELRKVIAIATPVPTHFEIAKGALTSGSDVFIEKPLCLSSKDSKELVEIAEREKRVLMVGHLLVHQPVVKEIQKAIPSIGKIRRIQGERLGLGTVRAVENSLWSLGVHDIAIILHLLGESPNSLQVSGTQVLPNRVEDEVHLELGFLSGISAHIHTSWLSPQKKRTLTITGEKGFLVFNELTQELVLHQKYIDEKRNVVDNGTKSLFTQKADLLQLELSHFLECVENRKRPLTSGEQGAEVVKVLERADQILKGSSMTKTKYSVHETALVDEGAEVGEGTKIWHFSHVSSGAVIGKGCSLGQNVFVAKNTRIGNSVKIQNNVSIYEGVTLEDHVFCGPSMVFTNVRTPRSAFPRNKSEDYFPTFVEKGASLGANCTIVCGTRVGQNAFVAAGAVVTKDVPPHALVAGVPAKIIGWACACGATLEFKGSAGTCPDCKTTYQKTENGIRKSELKLAA